MKKHIFVASLLLASFPGSARIAPGEVGDVQVRAFFKTYCIHCHGPEEQAGTPGQAIARFEHLAQQRTADAAKAENRQWNRQESTPPSDHG